MRYAFIIINLFSGFIVNCQISPLEGAHLNYTQVLFEIPEVKGAAYYEFSVIQEGGGFEKPDIIQIDSSQVTVVSDLQFGKAYEWQVTAFDETNLLIEKSKVFHFQIDNSELVDPELHRFLVLKNEKEKCENGIIVLDFSGVMIDRSGSPVWFLPELEGVKLHGEGFRDLKFTEKGTLTFMGNKLCREMDLNGRTIWGTTKKGIFSGEETEFFHHDFTKLKSGNYMALALRKKSIEVKIDNSLYTEIPMSVIIEYNQKGDTVWTWDSEGYITDDDIRSLIDKVKLGNTFGNMNSFFVDEERGEVIVSFRDFNAILVIDKKTKKVIRTIGDKLPSVSNAHEESLFRRQHAAVLLSDNEIMLFNNNTADRNQRATPVSSVQIVSIPLMQDEKAKVLWEFPCNFDDRTNGYSPRLGSSFPIDSNHFLVNQGQNPRIFEVNRDKEVVWDCIPEEKRSNINLWQPEPNYRAMFIKSLYPVYFSFSSKSNSSGRKFIEIVNEGSEKDSYFVKIYPNYKPKKLFEFQTSYVSAGNKIQIPVEISKKIKKGYRVEVVSIKNSELKKTNIY